jgi:hypothetical protein
MGGSAASGTLPGMVKTTMLIASATAIALVFINAIKNTYTHLEKGYF